MRKKILFIVSDMESGGFQKSLVSLLQCFNYEKYDVDLLILSPKGIFLNQIPKQVNLLHLDFTSSFFEPFPQCISKMIKEREYKNSIKRTYHFLLSRLDKSKAGIYMSKNIPQVSKEYDVAIDYNGQQILYYMVDKIKAKKKISYFHSDYKKWDYYKKADQKYYPKVDYIVTISDICKESLEEVFPECKEKVQVIHNISSPKIIKKMAEEKCEIVFDKDYMNIIMVGRPSDVKGYDFAIKACQKLKEDNKKVRFYSIGTSNDVKKFENMVKNLKLENEFIFIGETNNPYQYIKQADIYIQPSRFEGKSVAIDEAKILAKPIILTNFTTAPDHIVNEVNGLIVNMNSDGLYNGIKRLITDNNIMKKFSDNLKVENLGNEDEVYKLYKLIEE